MVLLNRLPSAAAAGLLLALAAGGAKAADAAPAFLRVTLPADATLTIDGQPTESTSADRTFVTPPLEMGKDFHYTLKAEFVRGDQTVAVTQQVVVRAGRETAVSFAPSAATAPSGMPARYYSPGTPATGPGVQVLPPLRYNPVSPPVHGGVGGARDNWKPDFSDPFLMGPG